MALLPAASVLASTTAIGLPEPRALAFAALIALFLVLLATLAVQKLLH